MFNKTTFTNELKPFAQRNQQNEIKIMSNKRMNESSEDILKYFAVGLLIFAPRQRNTLDIERYFSSSSILSQL